MLDKMRDNASSWAIKILFAVIILAFIITFANPGGRGKDTMVTVYDQSLSVEQYLRNLRPEAENDPQARQFVLYSLVNNMLLQHKADELGLVPSDKEVAQHIMLMKEFQVDGQFSMERYQRALRNVKEFEQTEKDTLAVNTIERFAAMTSLPVEAEAKALFEWQNERIRLDYLVISPADFNAIVDVPEDLIQQEYDSHPEKYASEARIRVKYLRFTPKALAVTQEVSEEEVAAFYEEMAATLKTKRLVTLRQIVVPVAEDATVAEQTTARETAEEAYQAILAGADPADVAAKQAKAAGDPALAEVRTLDPELLPEELVQALNGLPLEQVSEPVRTHQGYVLAQLLGVEEPRPLTLEEAHDDIRLRLAEEKAAQAIDDLLDATIGSLSQGMSLTEIADSMSLPTEESEPLTRGDLQEEFGISPEAADTLFSLVQGTTTRTPLLLDGGGYLLAEKVEDIPSEPKPLDEVRDAIKAELAKDRTQELARTEVQELITAIQDPEKDADAALELYAHLIHTSEPFTRSQSVPGVQVDPALTAAAFQAPVGKWIPGAFAAENGLLLARVAERLPAEQTDWEVQKDVWMSAIAKANTSQTMQALSNNLFLKANEAGAIDLIRPDLIGQDQ